MNRVTRVLPKYPGTLNDSRCNSSSTEAEVLVAFTGHNQTPPESGISDYKLTVRKPTGSKVYSMQRNKESSLHYRKQQGVKFTVRKETRSQVYITESNKESSLQYGKQQVVKFIVRKTTRSQVYSTDRRWVT
ncbi:hypothetical protein AVEN_43609-1 [Araneus ventricosus]|uniref:Uncharacterized protein n=1 Tax=Araneus ventricosus TaxID=182803 RepID=A0A4Y2MV39_ARAVE|nr:hypothetical protein AVEN_43609-1 [Araneus ventricosus]